MEAVKSRNLNVVKIIDEEFDKFHALSTTAIGWIFDDITKHSTIEILDYFVKKYPEDYQSGWTQDVEGYSMGEQIKQYAEEGEFDKDSNVIAIFPDHGSRYMSKVFSDDWMNDQGFFDSVNEEEEQKIEFVK